MLNLDDFYRDGADAALPHLGAHAEDLVDWDHPASWLHDEAVAAIETLCSSGHALVPVYDIANDRRTGSREMRLGTADHFVAEGIFAQEVVAECRARGLLADAVCLRNHPVLTFWRRLSRDLRERRKPPWVLVRRGLLLLRREPEVVAHAVALGCTPMTSEAAYRHLRPLSLKSTAPSSDVPGGPPAPRWGPRGRGG